MNRIGPTFLLVLTACGSDANVEGNYTMGVTNRDNGCNLQNWTVGEMSSGIGVMVNQEGDAVSATIGGATGLVLDVVLGGHVYTGGVDGESIELDLFGTRSSTMGNCTFTFNSVIRGDLSGNALAGTIEYSAAGNGNPDCTSVDGCVSVQEFAGSRPPP